MNGSILIVDDEKDMLILLKRILSEETPYKLVTESDPRQALERVRQRHFDVVLTDLKMPQMDGIRLLEACKQIRPEISVIILTAYATIENAVEAIQKGAHDYITKPFSLRELLARIKAILRRAPVGKEESGESSLIQIGNIQVNFKNYQAMEGNSEVKMSHKEFEVLHFLYKNAGKTVHRDDLMSSVWSIEYDITTRTVDNFIMKLRQKIETDPNNPKIILTVHGVGYKMILDRT